MSINVASNRIFSFLVTSVTEDSISIRAVVRSAEESDSRVFHRTPPMLSQEYLIHPRCFHKSPWDVRNEPNPVFFGGQHSFPASDVLHLKPGDLVRCAGLGGLADPGVDVREQQRDEFAKPLMLAVCDPQVIANLLTGGEGVPAMPVEGEQNDAVMTFLKSSQSASPPYGAYEEEFIQDAFADYIRSEKEAIILVVMPDHDGKISPRLLATRGSGPYWMLEYNGDDLEFAGVSDIKDLTSGVWATETASAWSSGGGMWDDHDAGIDCDWRPANEADLARFGFKDIGSIVDEILGHSDEPDELAIALGNPRTIEELSMSVATLSTRPELTETTAAP